MAKKPKFAVGTIVKLKSGGPDMTVREPLIHYTSEEFLGSYSCQWFAGKKSEVDKFPEDSLELVKPEAKGA
ncbi:uncharacterized protein YodC (DUF2158 family) [Variovorax boronicumulans]|uniref:Uncharacterized protein YodC (DUF2158 family) n=1 Tax=Variovorax boronicumulans TaxID=436515 RepID=A0AAW8DUH6_9BURK|nr:DUF2158 domain-containing protein [Variovorax boronicumulans]MDP9877822.1 uncharacterized protein YodC (DUF2158 family) [Variovorax boronicumulans]MDP9923106.1 uncharacterized protein YodC (DUF2158 family) [Variovorax boronicumulans]